MSVQTGLLPIQPVILPVTIDTMLKNGLNISDGLNFVTCEQTFKILYLLLICSFLIFLTLSSFSSCFLALQKVISSNH